MAWLRDRVRTNRVDDWPREWLESAERGLRWSRPTVPRPSGPARELRPRRNPADRRTRPGGDRRMRYARGRSGWPGSAPTRSAASSGLVLLAMIGILLLIGLVKGFVSLW